MFECQITDRCGWEVVDRDGMESDEVVETGRGKITQGFVDLSKEFKWTRVCMSTTYELCV